MVAATICSERLGTNQLCHSTLTLYHAVCSSFVLYSFSQSPKKVGDDIAKATGDWKGLRITVKLTIQNRQAAVSPWSVSTSTLALVDIQPLDAYKFCYCSRLKLCHQPQPSSSRRWRNLPVTGRRSRTVSNFLPHLNNILLEKACLCGFWPFVVIDCKPLITVLVCKSDFVLPKEG